MGRFLERLLEGSGVYRVERKTDGFVLTGEPDHLDEFSDLVREANDHSGQDFIVFTTSDGGLGYSQMFVIPLDEAGQTAR